MVPTASMDDPAFIAACADYNAGIVATGADHLALMYLDCPGRDALGAGRRFPSLLRDADTVTHQCDLDGITRVTKEEDVPAALCKLDNDGAESNDVIGFDLEWKSPILQTGFPILVVVF